ncbi:MAG: helix-hairpin-helix domain-containing protein [Deltaproteobacteria bacterium]|nr:helix-hairpin-helix domain-containing protein [Deltaproteobacteria bacterium]
MKSVLKKTVCVLLLVLLVAVSGLPAIAMEKMDINKATVEQLVDIKGVGEVLAQRIVVYRQQHEQFKSLEELTLVKGIGSRKLEKLRPFLMLVEN